MIYMFFEAVLITIDVSDCNLFKALGSSLERLFLGGLELAMISLLESFLGILLKLIV